MKRLKDQCEDIWKEIIKKKAGYKSELSGKEGTQIGGINIICAHHIGGKANYRLRFEIDNGICLTNGEHSFGIHNADRSEDYRERIKLVKGRDIYKRMLRLKREHSKTDLKLVKIYLQKELKKLQQNN